MMHAHIGVLKALHRHQARVFNPDAKGHHWGRRKLALGSSPGLIGSGLSSGAPSLVEQRIFDALALAVFFQPRLSWRRAKRADLTKRGWAKQLECP
jgi:hypothetical protein